jgi:hypothetical protein
MKRRVRNKIAKRALEKVKCGIKIDERESAALYKSFKTGVSNLVNSFNKIYSNN